jgi:hypothetical protein
MAARSFPVNANGLVVSLTAIGRGCLVVLLRLAYLGVTNALAMLRLLPMSDRAKDAEILALRHQVMILQRQLHGQKIHFTPLTGRCSPRCCTDSPAPCYARSGCWCAPRPCCAGIAT